MKTIVSLIKFVYVLITTICSLMLVGLIGSLGSSEDIRFKTAKMLLEIDGKRVEKVKKPKSNTGLKMKIGF